MKNFRRFLPDALLLGAVLATAFLLLPRPAAATAPGDLPPAAAPREVTIRLRASGLEVPTQAGIDPDSLTGQALDSGDGTITDCHWELFRDSVWTADGETLWEEDPARRDLVITLTAQMAGDGPVFLLAGQEIRMGRGFFLSAGPLYMPMTIVGFDHP
ncbi:MAG: DUF4330 domain-containing protein [Clostridiaceae bacterium]|nr:DUF4330 domain-containing protein [Clostridiaceae bacterium]